MDYKPEELSNRLRAEGEGVLAFFHSLPPESWNSAVYTEGQPWRIRDLLAHFIAAEEGFQQLIQNVANGGSGAGDDIVVDEYNRRTVAELSQVEPADLVARYALVRERTVALVNGLTQDQLSHSGRHPAAGVATLGGMVRILYHHNNLHLRDARRVLREAAAERTTACGGAG